MREKEKKTKKRSLREETRLGNSKVSTVYDLRKTTQLVVVTRGIFVEGQAQTEPRQIHEH